MRRNSRKYELCAKLVDWLLVPFPCRRTEKPFDLSDVKTVILCETHMIGDLALIEPLIQSIKSAYPHMEIGIVGGAPAHFMYGAHKDTSWIVTADMRWHKKTYFQFLRSALTLRKFARRFDASTTLAIDCRGDFRNVLLLWFMGLKSILGFEFAGACKLLSHRIRTRRALSFYEFIEQVNAFVFGKENLLPKGNFHYLVAPKNHHVREAPTVLHLGASMALRRMSQADALALCQARLSRGTNILVIDFPEDTSFAEALVASLKEDGYTHAQVWKGSFAELLRLVKDASEVICLDSAILHFCIAFGTKTHAVFGPSLPDASLPRNHDVSVIENRALNCRPCGQKRCHNSLFQACYKTG